MTSQSIDRNFVEDATAYPQESDAIAVELSGHTFRLRPEVARGLMIDLGWSLGELLSEQEITAVACLHVPAKS